MFFTCGGLLGTGTLLHWLVKQCKLTFLGSYVNIILSNSSFFYNFSFFLLLFFCFNFFFFKKNKQPLLLFSQVLVFCYLVCLYRQYGFQFCENDSLNNPDRLGWKKIFNALFDFSGPGLLHGISFLTTCCFFFYNTTLSDFKANAKDLNNGIIFLTKTVFTLLLSAYVLTTGAYWAYFSAVWGNWYNNDIIEVYYVVFFIATSLYFHKKGKAYATGRVFACLLALTLLFLTLLRFGVVNTKHTGAQSLSFTNAWWLLSLIGFFATPVTLYIVFRRKVSSGLLTPFSYLIRGKNAETGWVYIYGSFVCFFIATCLLALLPRLSLFIYFFYINFVFFFFILSALLTFAEFTNWNSPMYVRWRNIHLILVFALAVFLLFAWSFFVIDKVGLVSVVGVSSKLYTGFYKIRTHALFSVSCTTNANNRLVAEVEQLRFKSMQKAGSGWFCSTSFNGTTMLDAFNDETGVQSSHFKSSKLVYRKQTVVSNWDAKNHINVSTKSRPHSSVVRPFRLEYDWFFFLICWAMLALVCF